MLLTAFFPWSESESNNLKTEKKQNINAHAMKMLGQIWAGIGFSFPEEGWICFSVANEVGSHAECSSPFLWYKQVFCF